MFVCLRSQSRISARVQLSYGFRDELSVELASFLGLSAAPPPHSWSDNSRHTRKHPLPSSTTPEVSDGTTQRALPPNPTRLQEVISGKIQRTRNRSAPSDVRNDQR